MPRSESGYWWEILLSLRKLFPDKNDPFTSTEFAKEVGVSIKTAGAWLGKFVKWGYLIRVGIKPSGGGRPYVLWELTDHGRDRPKPIKWKGPSKVPALPRHQRHRQLLVAANPAPKRRSKR